MRFIIAIPASLLLTVVLFFAGAFFGGACHCMTAITIFFPYGTFLTMRTSWETAGLLADVLQFPIYATIGVVPQQVRKRLIVFLVLAVIHGVAAIASLTSYSWWS